MSLVKQLKKKLSIDEIGEIPCVAPVCDGKYVFANIVIIVAKMCQRIILAYLL